MPRIDTSGRDNVTRITGSRCARVQTRRRRRPWLACRFLSMHASTRSAIQLETTL